VSRGVVKFGSARRRVLVVAAAVVVGVLSLSGCGADLQPGAAAKIQHDGVNGAGVVDSTIDEGTVDDLTSAFCSYIAEENKVAQQPQQIAQATIRSQLLNALIQFQLMNSLAESRGLTMRPSDVAAAQAKGSPPLPPTLSDKDTALLKKFLYDTAVATLQQSVLAANLSDSGQTTSEGVTAGATAGSDGVKNKWFEQAAVDVNPSYGTWDGREVVGSTGSLSDLVSTSGPSTADPSSLPDSQVCG
jgi:hypothetical protein